MFERIQIMKKSRMCSVQHVHSNPNTLPLTSHGLARKVWQLVLTLKLTQKPKIALRLREVRLQKGLRELGLNSAVLCSESVLTIGWLGWNSWGIGADS